MTKALKRGKVHDSRPIYEYAYIKPLLVEAILDNFQQVEGDEIEAIVTHWLQTPTMQPPFFTPEMQHHCLKLLDIAKKRTKCSDMLSEVLAVYQPSILLDWADIPFPPLRDARFTFIDLFAGIGGFRIAMQANGGKCVFSSEWDPYAKKTYEANFGEVPYGDIRKIDECSIPDHDVLCAGFPCQPFSLAGVSARNALNTAHGFACETQGTLFFDIARIITAKMPKIVFLENVKNLVNHDSGKTFAVISSTIESLGYKFSYQIIDSSPLVPQRRVRCYMVCVRNDMPDFIFPEIKGPALPLRNFLEDNVNGNYTISDKLWKGHKRRTKLNVERGTGFTAYCADLDKPANTIVARYGKDGKECLIPQKNMNPRMLTPRECARLQGFPEKFIMPNAKTVAYRQFGNSVAVPVIQKIGEQVLKVLRTNNS